MKIRTNHKLRPYLACKERPSVYLKIVIKKKVKTLETWLVKYAKEVINL